MSKSRNQREGKFIPGWCYNPAYKIDRVEKGVTHMKAKKRAGSHYNLVRVQQFNDYGYAIPGVTFVRYVREGAFE